MDDEPYCDNCGRDINRGKDGYTYDEETGAYLCDRCDPDPDEDEYAEYLIGRDY